MPVPLTPAQELAALRVKYPTGLLCTSPEPCEHRVLATTPAGYSESNLTEEARQAFICACCRQALAERQRALEARRDALKLARAVAAQNARDRRDQGEIPGSTDTPSADPHEQRENDAGFDLHDPRPIPANSHRRGGRPRKHATDRARRTAAQRAYRTRKAVA